MKQRYYIQAEKNLLVVVIFCSRLKTSYSDVYSRDFCSAGEVTVIIEPFKPFDAHCCQSYGYSYKAASARLG